MLHLEQEKKDPMFSKHTPQENPDKTIKQTPRQTLSQANPQNKIPKTNQPQGNQAASKARMSSHTMVEMTKVNRHCCCVQAAKCGAYLCIPESIAEETGFLWTLQTSRKS